MIAYCFSKICAHDWLIENDDEYKMAYETNQKYLSTRNRLIRTDNSKATNFINRKIDQTSLAGVPKSITGNPIFCTNNKCGYALLYKKGKQPL